MKLQDKFLIGLAVAIGIALLIFARPHVAANLGSASDNVLSAVPTATQVWITTSDTLVAATSTSRSYLEISNISGATSSNPQPLFCNVGDRPSVVYQGITIHASSSKVFNLDNLPRGAIRCRFPVAAAAVTVLDN